MLARPFHRRLASVSFCLLTALGTTGAAAQSDPDPVLGSCCFGLGGPSPGCADGLTEAECTSIPTIGCNVFRPEEMCINPPFADDCCDCCMHYDCDDGNVCTIDRCDECCQCAYSPVAGWDPATECCHPVNGQQWSLPANKPCVTYSCGSMAGQIIASSKPAGTPCDEGDPCAVNSVCDGSGHCVGAEFAGPDCPKPRYITLNPSLTGLSALRVILTSLHHPDPPYPRGANAADFSAFENTEFWVGPVADCSESPLGGYFKCAFLKCEPHYADWTVELEGGSLHVTSEAVVPSSLYDVAQLMASCAGAEASCNDLSYLPPVSTGRWGDVAWPYQQPGEPYPTQPDVRDIGEQVDSLKAVPGAACKVRAQICGNCPDPAANLNVLDVAYAVDAVKGFGYPFAGPSPCP